MVLLHRRPSRVKICPTRPSTGWPSYCWTFAVRGRRCKIYQPVQSPMIATYLSSLQKSTAFYFMPERVSSTRLHFASKNRLSYTTGDDEISPSSRSLPFSHHSCARTRATLNTWDPSRAYSMSRLNSLFDRIA